MSFTCEACHAARQHGLDWAPPEGGCIHEHPHVLLRAHGNEAYVDDGMALLISELWRHGVRTYFSCQGGGWAINYPGYRLRGYVSYHWDDHDTAEEVLDAAGLDPEFTYLARRDEVIARWRP